MAKRRIIKEVVNHEIPTYKSTRYLCQERHYDAESSTYYWETMKYTRDDFEEEKAIFYTLEKAQSFLAGNWGRSSIEVVYEEE